MQGCTQSEIRQLEEVIATIAEANKFLASWEFDADPSSGLSRKVSLLQTSLRQQFLESDKQRCFIFVEKRYTAKCLFEVLKDSVSPHFRLGMIIGRRSSDTVGGNFTARDQMLGVSRFRSGKLNCLIATSVAEEGLDVPDCNLIYRFDLYSTMIQYIQSRGRARHRDSRYHHMIEEGNRTQLGTLKECLDAELSMKRFCTSLPEDRLLNEQPTEEDASDPYYLEESTGARLTFSCAMQIISAYTSNLVSST